MKNTQRAITINPTDKTAMSVVLSVKIASQGFTLSNSIILLVFKVSNSFPQI
ncbi:MAG: hypothetical protein IKO56_06135 [Alphaproteobacteria bacterium]|nr:hypothetical protein [Alphaproteobacteria bacterium]